MKKRELHDSGSLQEPLLSGAGAAGEVPMGVPVTDQQPSAVAAAVPVAAPAGDVAPWSIPHQNVYDHSHGGQSSSASAPTLAAPVFCADADTEQWRAERCATLREWGRRREQSLHRLPTCLMDQMLSGGTALYPPRLLDPAQWLTAQERVALGAIEQLTAATGGGTPLAMDMLAPLIYGVNVKIILDNSGSMGGDLFGNFTFSGNGPTVGLSGNGAPGGVAWIDQMTRTCKLRQPLAWGGFSQDFYSPADAFSEMFRQRQRCGPMGCCDNPCAGCCGPAGPCGPSTLARPVQSPVDPRHRRWWFARDHVRKWKAVYRAMGIYPPMYLLNAAGRYGTKVEGDFDVDAFFRETRPGGTTPMTLAVVRALEDHAAECRAQRQDPRTTPLLLLVVTDGEANNMALFNSAMDTVQNKHWGDVQCCLMGLSLVPEDIEWFENEECDDTRVRTVECFEVEQQQMLRREVITREGDYNFDMHVFRTLLTNFFPADYDYEAPIQNMRHRLYITLHGWDRWWSLRSVGVERTLAQARYGGGAGYGYQSAAAAQQLCGCYQCCSDCCGAAVCTPLYVLTGACCCGLLQGQECCQCRPTDCLDACGGE